MGKGRLPLHQSRWTGSDPMPEIVESLADIEGVSPSDLSNELEGPLYNYVDGGALKRLITHSEGVSISFTVESYRVELDDRQLTIYEES